MNFEISHYHLLAHIQLTQIHVNIWGNNVSRAQELNSPFDGIQRGTCQICRVINNTQQSKTLYTQHNNELNKMLWEVGVKQKAKNVE